MIEWLAIGVHSTAVGQKTRVLANAVNTRPVFVAVVVETTAGYALSIFTDLSQNAFAILQTLRRSFSTDNIGVAFEAGRTRTHRSVVERLANSVPTAHTKQTARVLTDAVNTRLFETTALTIATPDYTTRVVAHQSIATIAISGAFVDILKWSAFNVRVTDEA